MAIHEIKVTFNSLQVTNRDVEFAIFRSSGSKARLGTLKISRGSLDWRDASDAHSHVILWEKFAELAKKHGRKKKKR